MRLAFRIAIGPLMNLLVLADDDACERQIDDGPADVVIACGDFSKVRRVGFSPRPQDSQRRVG